MQQFLNLPSIQTKDKNWILNQMMNLICNFSLMIFPQAGPDIKYLLGFIRTQLSTSVTIVLVFGPKVIFSLYTESF